MNPTDFDEFHEIVYRLGIAALMGGTLGVDRDLHRKPAGLRVLALVSLGSAVATMASLMVAATAGKNLEGVLRVTQGILAGIGFLGAGVILRSPGGDEVHGLTTAAAVWVSAVLGIVCGLGEWRLAWAALGATLTIMILGRHAELTIIRWGEWFRTRD